MADAQTNYIEEARKQLQGQFDTAKNELQGNYEKDFYELDSQTGTMNKQYDGQIQSSKETGENNKASYNNSTINRGLGRSTIATTGITGIDNTTAKNVTALEGQRQLQLDNIDKLKTLLRNNLTNSLSSLNSSYNSNLNSLASQLQEKEEARRLQQEQLAWQKQQWQAEMDLKKNQYNTDTKYKYDSLAWDKEKAQMSASSSSSSSKTTKEQVAIDGIAWVQKYLKSGDLTSAKTTLTTMKAYGVSDDLIEEAQEYIDNYKPSVVSNSNKNNSSSGGLTGSGQYGLFNAFQSVFNKK